MKLYEINQQIYELILRLEPDPDTGEIAAETDDIVAELNALEMQRTDILRYLAKVVLDTRADVSALKAEEKRLHERRVALERRDENLMDILDRECAGEKTDCGVATVCYRKTTKVDIQDNTTAMDWLIKNGYKDFIRYAEPEICKNDVKKLLSSGSEIPGAVLLQDMSCSLR